MGQMQDNTKLNIEKINNEARAWFVKIYYGGNACSQQKDFDEWLAVHQLHQKIYDDICVFMQRAEAYTSDPLCAEKYKDLLPKESHRIEDPVENIITFKAPVQKIRQIDQQRPLLSKKLFLGSIAASLLLLVGAGVLFQIFLNDATYQTIVGEQRTVMLADGSKVKLNTNTEIKVNFSHNKRSVRLNHGQAYFIIAQDRERPFVVNFSEGSVTALGTQFDVYNTGRKVVVSLVEGAVKIHSNALQEPLSQEELTIQSSPSDVTMVVDDNDKDVGAQIVLSSKGMSSVIKTDNKQISSWMGQQLIFADSTLGYVVSELNRYSIRKIIIKDSDLANEYVNGVFPVQIREALEIIKNYLNLTTTVNSKGEIVLERSIKNSNTSH